MEPQIWKQPYSPTLFEQSVRSIIDLAVHFSLSRHLEPEAIAGQNNNSSGSVDAQETKKIVAHDALIPEQIDSLREQHKSKKKTTATLAWTSRSFSVGSQSDDWTFAKHGIDKWIFLGGINGESFFSKFGRLGGNLD